MGVTAAAFAGEILISGSADNTTRIWDLRGGGPPTVVRHPRTVFGVSVRPEAPPAPSSATAQQGAVPTSAEVAAANASREFATACWDGVVRVFSVAGGELKGELSGHSGGVYSVAYSPLDGSLLASSGADRTVRIWDLNRMEALWTLRAHGDHVTSVDWSPLEPFTLASGGWDRKFRLWDIGAAEAAACRGTLNCSQLLRPWATGRHPQLVWRVAFAPGGTLVAACHGAVGQSPTVVIYDAATGKVCRRLGRHRDTPLAVAWSADGAVLASAGMDHKVLLYDAHGRLDDMPQGDPDDAEESQRWLSDLLELRTGVQRGDENASAGGNRSDNATSLPVATFRWQPPPLGGRAAVL